MKSVDKDTLMKHHYWLVAAAALLVSLAAIFMLKTSVRGQIVSKRNELEKTFNSVQSTANGPIPTRATIEKLKGFADKFKAQEEVAWRDIYQKQEPFLRFAHDVEKTYRFTRDPVSGIPGFFATQIAILAGDATLPESIDGGPTFSGEVKTIASDRISVSGTLKVTYTKKVAKKVDPVVDPEAPEGEKKEEPKPEFEEVKEEKEEPRTLEFFKTPKVKITKAGAEEDLEFRSINVGDKVTVTFDRGRYFLEPLTQEERSLYESSYYKQFEEIVRQVNPIDPDGIGVVQLFDGSGASWPVARDEWEMPPTTVRFLRFLDKKDFNPVQDWSELAWLSQEDIWVYREIFRLVDQANFYVRNFKQNETVKDAWVGQNANWEAELKIPEAGKFSVKLKNLLPRRQSLGVNLNVWFKNSKEPERVTVAGESARDARGGAKDTSAVKVFEIENGDLGPVQRVEQELTWDLAAVKRIDEIAIGVDGKGVSAHSHRTFPQGVKPFKEEPKPEGAPAGGGMDPMGMGGGLGPRPDMGGGKLPPPGGVDGKGGFGVGGLLDTKARYSEVTPQARKLPIAVTLIVDQQHVDRVQISFANSELRFLTTQVLMNRYPFSVNPRLNMKDDKGLDKGGVGKGPMGPLVPPMPGGPRSSLGPVGPPGMPPGFPMGDMGFGGDSGGRSDENESNVELTIYGTITIYERFPPRTKVESAPAVP